MSETDGASAQTTPELSEAIGRISVNFTWLERLITYMINMLVDPKDLHVGALITAKRFFRYRLDLLEMLVDHRVKDEEVSQRFADFFEDAKYILKVRNEVIHSHLLMTDDEQQFMRVRDKSFWSEDIYRDMYSVKDAEELLERMYQANGEASELIMDIWKLFPPV